MDENLQTNETPSQNNNNLAVVGLVLGIVACVFIFIPLIGYIGTLCGIGGIVVSVMARKQGASGMATAGLVLSIIATAFTFIFFLACVACAAAGAGILSNLPY
ncbi:MAG: DUF4190 domain-containing protein [Clostridiales bacterium]|jgi:hypothetical protein|nr:DUF4190 domain-containing protein [Clostridiales bacterium]